MHALAKSVLLASLFVAWPVDAQQVVRESDPEHASAQERMCAQAKCQRNVHVVMKQKDGATFDKTFPVFSPIVQEMGITVVAGQTVYVEADIDKGRLTNMKAVDAVVDASKTIVATFTQSDDGGMMLRVTSPFEQTIKFDMGIMPLDGNDLYRTSSCPITDGVFEMWPEPIFLVVLANGRVVDSTANVCE